ncbi:MAG: GH36-type glycosyl hydrolase domain-containing protein [Candidatus Odinarchaeota archaeon]
MSKKAFGSGYFGEWIIDEHGLPAYNYTCDQITDPKAIIPLNEKLRSNKDHLHQVGNDRIVGVASNFGYIQVRQDEGCPKFLNDYDPEHNQFAGGIGYLVDGEYIINTFYSGNVDHFQRVFGIGYFRKIVKQHDLSVDQVIFAPYGDDPLLISQVSITNNRDQPKNLRWIEYWGCKSFQFSALAYYSAFGKKDLSLMNKSRREFSSKFTHEFSLIENYGLLETAYFQDGKEPNKRKVRAPVYESNFLPKTFLVSLNGSIERFGVNEQDFFGSGGINHPDGINSALASKLNTINDGNAMILEREVYLEPQESQTLYFAYGYLPEDANLDQIIKKYKKEISKQWIYSSECWKKNKILLSIPDEPWVERELLWHNYYLRAAMTYDDYFNEHILSQGHVYQYIIGAQIAARDPLQHTLPFIYSEPLIVKEIIRYILKTVKKNGEVPYGVIGNGMIMPLPFFPSDLELWLLWTSSEYVIATKDTKFLDEVIPTYPIYGKQAGTSTVINLLMLCYTHFTEVTGTGKHGLQRISNGDWNDGAVMGFVPEEKHDEVRTQGESVLNASMTIYVFNKFAELLKIINEDAMAKRVYKYAELQKKSVKAQWNGNWFKRAWFTNDLGWIGNKELWLEPQPWAIIGNAVDNEWIPVLIDNINKHLRISSKIGARILSKDIDDIKREVGMRVNGGIWASINGTLIWALSQVNGEMAWDEWKKNTLAFHAEAFPGIWYGIWSGPDTYNSDLSKYHGHTHFFEYFITGDPNDKKIMLEDPFGISWTDFPVMNLHPHAWPIFNLIHLIGANFTKNGVEITPSLPKEEYYFESPLFGFSKSKLGYSGWYTPSVSGSWTISLKLKESEISSFKFLKVNNKVEEIRVKDNFILITGTSTPEEPFMWELKKNKL